MGKPRFRKTKPNYPWDRWFGQTTTTLVKGKHYNCATHGMVAQIRTVAGARGKSVVIKTATDGTTIQFTVGEKNAQP